MTIVGSKLDDRIAIVFIGSLHLQLILGIVLYFFLSPITTFPFPEDWMKNKELRFYLLEHPLSMFIAIVLAQIGRIVTRKATNDRKKLRKSLLFYGISLVIILVRIPWDR